MIALSILVALTTVLPAQAASAEVPAAAQEADARTELVRFVELLGRLRAGEEAVLADLAAGAARLCERHARCDTGDVLAHYAALTPDERALGLVEEQRFLALRRRVFEAGHGDTAGELWDGERRLILADLRALVERVRTQADFVPAAQALSLCAEIELQRLEESPGLAAAERAPLADRVARDAQAARELFERAGQVTPRLAPTWIVGRIERIRRDERGARESFEACYADALAVGRDEYREKALHGLISLAHDAGSALEVERRVQQLATFRTPAQSWPLTREWAMVLLQRGHADEAYAFLGEYEPAADAHAADFVEWELCMGSAAMRAGRTGEARAHFEHLAGGPSSDLAGLALARLALVEARPIEAFALLDRPGLYERLDRKDQSEWQAMMGEAALAIDEPQRAAEHLERSLALARGWDREAWAGFDARGEPARSNAEGAARSVMGEWRGLHTVALLADTYRRLARPLAAIRVIEGSQSASLRGRQEEVRRLREAAGLDVSPGPVSADELLSWTRHTELGLVTWVVGADFSVVAWAGPGEGAQLRAYVQRLEFGRAAIAEATRRLREAVLSKNDAQTRRVAAEIRAALLPDAIVARLTMALATTPTDEPRLLLLPHGPLERLPWEVLPLGDGALDDAITTLVLPGLPEARPGAAPSFGVEARWQLLGAPVDAQGRALLPGATRELDDLAQAYPRSTLVTAAEFDAEHVARALAGSDPVHVATHLVMECDREDLRLAPAAFVLSDGASLCAHAVARLRPALPLAVLSACHSGEGRLVDAEGLQGMARAFLESGTRNVVVTLWPVEDLAAHGFAVRFHAGLAAGDPPSVAARRARSELREAGAPAADWAAFRLLGRD